jgi:GGDEF domain-containing protein
VAGRKEPDPGARPHPARAAAEAGPVRDDDPRLQPVYSKTAIVRAWPNAETAADYASLITAADRALYSAKSDGRDRLVMSAK